MRLISKNSTALVLLVVLASACTSLPREDRAPRRPPDVSGVPDAVPREEPRSRYGNPQSYEVFGKRYHVLESAHGFKERGVASWYGEKFHGRRTSSGEPYDMYAMTAAHKSLPLPTYVRVTNLKNGRSVTVRVNDRGPFVHNRVIDLSYTAAAQLGILTNGTGLVEIEAISGQLQDRAAPPPSKPGTIVLSEEVATPEIKVAADVPEIPSQEADTGKIYIQLGAFSDPLNAEEFVTSLETRGFSPVQVMAAPQTERMIYRVRIGPVGGVPELDAITANLAAAGIENYHLAYE